MAKQNNTELIEAIAAEIRKRLHGLGKVVSVSSDAHLHTLQNSCIPC